MPLMNQTLFYRYVNMQIINISNYNYEAYSMYFLKAFHANTCILILDVHEL